ncbi:helix-turn-helix domain-containing protein, partial [Roseicella aquatilis]
ERDAAASRRMLALALVLEGQSRTTAARAAGMERQTLRFNACVERVHRYNAEGLAGLRDRVGETGPKRRLSPEQEKQLAEW